MLWFVLSILTAFFSATQAALIKRTLSDLSPLELAFVPMAFSIPLFALTLSLVPSPPLSPDFWPTVFLLLPFNLAGMLFTMWAVRLSPLSLTLPFLAFTPALVMVSGFVLLGEVPNWMGGVGIGGIVAGSYILNLKRGEHSLLAPFRAVTREKGSLLMLAAAVIFGLTAVLGKKIILQSSPLYAACVFFLIQNCAFVAGVLLSGKVRPNILWTRRWVGIAVGGVIFLEIFCHFLAVSMVDTAYMIAIKRLNGLFGVLYGGFLFKEEHLRERLTGAGLMTAGAALLALTG
ncbi:MAG: EamA family transporter [Desulfovibrionales bacterium]